MKRWAGAAVVLTLWGCSDGRGDQLSDAQCDALAVPIGVLLAGDIGDAEHLGTLLELDPSSQETPRPWRWVGDLQFHTAVTWRTDPHYVRTGASCAGDECPPPDRMLEVNADRWGTVDGPFQAAVQGSLSWEVHDHAGERLLVGESQATLLGVQYPAGRTDPTQTQWQDVQVTYEDVEVSAGERGATFTGGAIRYALTAGSWTTVEPVTAEAVATFDEGGAVSLAVGARRYRVLSDGRLEVR